MTACFQIKEDFKVKSSEFKCSKELIFFYHILTCSLLNEETYAVLISTDLSSFFFINSSLTIEHTCFT